MGRPDKGLTSSLDLRNKSSKKKQKERFYITEITNEDFSKFLKKFNNSPYLGYKIKQVHNEPTYAYFFQIKHITKIMKNETHVRLITNFVKLGANEIIGHVKEATQPEES